MKNDYDVLVFGAVLVFYVWVIRCSVGATYAVAFSFAVLCQLFTFSVICYFDYAVYIFFIMVLGMLFFFFISQIGLSCLYFYDAFLIATGT